MKIPVLSEREWNKLVDKISRRLPIKVMVTNDGGFAHPWSTSLEWDSAGTEYDASRGQWLMRMTPGFVNGVSPEISTFAKFANQRTIDRIEESGKKLADKDAVVAYLTEQPVVPIRRGQFRMIGTGASPTSINTDESGQLTSSFETVPEFFKSLGVGLANELTGNLTTGVQVVEQAVSADARLLCAFDVVLYVDRPAMKIDTSVRGNPFGDGFTQLLTYTYGRTSEANPLPYLRVETKFEPPMAGTASLLEGAADPEFDVIKVATVFLLSPQGAEVGSEPDGNWSPFVKHDLFWNLAHATAKITMPIDATPITIRTGLAGGLADMIGNQILAPNNDAYAEAALMLNARTLEGRFWTV